MVDSSEKITRNINEHMLILLGLKPGEFNKVVAKKIIVAVDQFLANKIGRK